LARPSIRNQQFIVFCSNPNIPDPGGSPVPVARDSWSNTGIWSPAPPASGDTVIMGPDATPGAVDSAFGPGAVLLDVPVTLSGLSWTAPGIDIANFDANHQSGSTQNITTGASGLVIGGAPGSPSYGAAPGHNVLTTTYLLQRVQPHIVGSGSVTITGPSVSGLNTGNSFTGGLNVVNGTLGLWAITANGSTDLEGTNTPDDSSLGSGSVTLNNGTLEFVDIRQLTAAPLISRQINLAPGSTNDVWGTSNPTLTGVISGGAGGTMQFGKPIFASVVELQGNNTYTANTKVIDGQLKLTGNGAIASSPVVDVAGITGGGIGPSLVLGTIVDNSVNRLNDTGTLRLNGAGVSLQAGNSSYSETVGTLMLGGGMNVVKLLSNGAGLNASLTATNVSRENNGGLFIQGANLGTGSASLFIGNGAALAIGGGGAAGTTNQSIIPFMWSTKGALNSEGAVGSGTGTFVTYTPATGVRPLDLATEYKAGFSGAAATDNVKVDAGTSNAAGSGQVINALRLGNAGGTGTGTPPTVTGGPLTITSGAILNAVQGSVISANISAPAGQELVILTGSGGSGTDTGTGANNGLRITGAISGNGGLTKIGLGNLYLDGPNTYTGQTTITHGRVFLHSNVLADGVTPGPFGLSTTPIVLVAPNENPGGGGGNQVRLLNEAATGSITIARDIEIRGRGASGVQIGGFTAGATTNLNGNLILNQEKYTAAGFNGNVTVNGVVSGTGLLSDVQQAAISTVVTLNANSPAWSGGADMNGGANQQTAGLWQVGADQAFGTGPVQIDGWDILRATNGARTIANDVYTNPANANMVMFDGPLTLSGKLDLGNGVRGGNVTNTGSAPRHRHRQRRVSQLLRQRHHRRVHARERRDGPEGQWRAEHR